MKSNEILRIKLNTKIKSISAEDEQNEEKKSIF